MKTRIKDKPSATVGFWGETYQPLVSSHIQWTIDNKDSSIIHILPNPTGGLIIKKQCPKGHFIEIHNGKNSSSPIILESKENFSQPQVWLSYTNALIAYRSMDQEKIIIYDLHAHLSREVFLPLKGHHTVCEGLFFNQTYFSISQVFCSAPITNLNISVNHIAESKAIEELSFETTVNSVTNILSDHVAYPLSENLILLTSFTSHLEEDKNYLYIVDLKNKTIAERRIPVEYDMSRRVFVTPLLNNCFAILVTHIVHIYEYANQRINLKGKIPLGNERRIYGFAVSPHEKQFITLESDPTFRCFTPQYKLKRWNSIDGSPHDLQTYTINIPAHENINVIRLFPDGQLAYYTPHTFGIVEYSSYKQLMNDAIQSATELPNVLVDIITEYTQGVSRNRYPAHID